VVFGGEECFFVVLVAYMWFCRRSKKRMRKMEASYVCSPFLLEEKKKINIEGEVKKKQGHVNQSFAPNSCMVNQS